MKSIKKLKEKKQREEALAAQCREAANKHETNAKRIQDEILYLQGAEYVKMFSGIHLEEEQFQEAKNILFSDQESFLQALHYLQKQKTKTEEGETPLYE